MKEIKLNENQIAIPKIQGYVICDIDEKTFSRGGMVAKFSLKSPKIYKNIGHVKTHLLQHIITNYTHYSNPIKRVYFMISNCYKNRNCVVYDITDNSVVLNVTEYFKEQLNKKKNEQIKRYNYAPENVIINYEKF